MFQLISSKCAFLALLNATLKEDKLVLLYHICCMGWPNFCIFCVCQELHKYKENEKDTEVLMSALSAMQDKTQHLENSLSAETRIKLDLFSALGDAKRQLEIAQGSLISCPALFILVVRVSSQVESDGDHWQRPVLNLTF